MSATQPTLGWPLDHTLSYREHLTKTADKLKNQNNLLMKLAGSTWGTSANTVVICSGALLFSSRVLCPSLVTLCSHKSGRCAVELYHAPHLWYPPFCTFPMASSDLRHWTASPTKKAGTDKLVEKIVKHDSWPIQPDILNPPLLRLTSRKPLWLDVQPVDIKSRWRHTCNWKSAQVVNSHNPATRFRLPSEQWSLLNRFHMEQGHSGACRRKWRLTLICVLVARPRRCSTLSNPVAWQNWMTAYLGYTLQMKMLFRGWPVMVHDMHTRRRRMLQN